MDAFTSTAAILAVMLAIVLLFRTLVRRPARGTYTDPPGVRSVVVFSGDDPQFFQADRQEVPFVGVRLFEMLCDGLKAGGIEVVEQGNLQNAQRAFCAVQTQRFAVVLERIEARWVVSVEWHPFRRAELRHIDWTADGFSPPDGAPLRQLLQTLHDWLKTHPKLTGVAWHRKEKWLLEDTSDPSDTPVSTAGSPPPERSPGAFEGNDP